MLEVRGLAGRSLLVCPDGLAALEASKADLLITLAHPQRVVNINPPMI
jgi:hypothetical protein